MLGLKSLLDDLAGIAADGNQQWRTLLIAVYNSPELFTLEREKISKANWFCIGRADQVPRPGDYLTAGSLANRWYWCAKQTSRFGCYPMCVDTDG